MQAWIIGGILAGAALAVSVLVCILRVRRRRRILNSTTHTIMMNRTPEFYAGLHRVRDETLDKNPRPNPRRPRGEIVQHGKGGAGVYYSAKAFSWNDHPSLVAEAVEHGWATFAFTFTYQTPQSSRRFWDLCSGLSSTDHSFEPEMGWEIGNGEDYMQKIRFKAGYTAKKSSGTSSNSNSAMFVQVQCLQTLLPLPGPMLECGSFPQEAYFEIVVVAEGEEFDASKKSVGEGELVKLIAQGIPSSFSSVDDKTSTSVSSGPHKKTSSVSGSGAEFWSAGSGSVAEGSPRVVSVGLAVGGACLARLPGLESGSVGFHSTGFVYLNGMAYVDGDADKQNVNKHVVSWGHVGTDVGCGYAPAIKKVFYTLNGEKVYTLTSKSKDFGNPLYATVAANYDVTVLVNFGQSRFEYEPANAQRVSDPCFQRLKKVGAQSHDDSSDLFSLGKADSQWIQMVQSPSQELQTKYLTSEADSDLFEIVLDGAK